MSGILCVWNSQKTTPWSQMLAEMSAFGHDGQGEWHDHVVGLRLGRSQFFNTPESCLEPPVVESEGCVLVWDGRLDDRTALLAGRRQVTDAQLIIESYRRWGVECLRHLMGEFVFILWDAVQDQLLVGCDVTGKRTIAYFWDGQTLLLSSRVLTLLRHPQVSHKLDPIYVAHTLCELWAHPPGITAFASIKRLCAGQALILRQGQLQIQQIHQLVGCDRYVLPKSPEESYEKFWYLLDQAIQDRLRTCLKPYATISGGLDSTTVSVALLKHLPSLDAFSVTSSIYPEFNEEKPIQAFLQSYPQVHWHPFEGDEVPAFSEPWDRLPIPDDPLITCVLPMNLRTMELAQQQGLQLQFGGGWGDEFCCSLWEDLIRAGQWRSILQAVRTEPRWYSFLFWTFVLPYLSTPWQNRWIRARLQNVRQQVPEWLTPTYQQKPEITLALQQRNRTLLNNSRVKAMQRLTTESGFIGATQVLRLLGYAYQNELVNPLGDQRLVEFAHSLHPALQMDEVYQKIFLRQVNRGKLPDEVRLRPKTNYFDPLKYAGLCKGHQPDLILGEAKNHAYLQEVIDLGELERNLWDYRERFAQEYCPEQPFYSRWGNQLNASITFTKWLMDVEKHYSLIFS
jgi:asparagine synthase (glutamine-hydrolysing)